MSTCINDWTLLIRIIKNSIENVENGCKNEIFYQFIKNHSRLDLDIKVNSLVNWIKR